LNENTTALSDKIRSKKAKVCVVGLGYVGVPLAVASAQAGFAVIGVDVEKEKVSMINKGICYVEDAYSEKHLPELVKAGLISATDSISNGATSSDIVIVCVPTPLNHKGDPDLSFLKSVAKDLSKNLSGFKLVLHETLGVDFIEAISAAATKPFGFMPHYPGPGVGGHCIPKDPFYLVFKAKQAGFLLRLVSASKAVNKMMPVHTIDRLAKALKTDKKSLPNATVVVWGLAYKGEVKDTRRSPSLELLKLLKQSRAKIRVFDPYVPRVMVGGKTYESSNSEIESVRDADALMIATAHNAFRTVDLSKIRSLMRDRPILYDTRNLRTRRECEEAGFTYLATGRP